MLLNEMIDRMVRSAINEQAKNIRIDRCVNRVLKEHMARLYEASDEVSDNKRSAVMSALKDPKYNHAQLAYSLWPDMDKDTARSLFAKKANGTPDADGAIRKYSDEEINKLYQLIRKK